MKLTKMAKFLKVANLKNSMATLGAIVQAVFPRAPEGIAAPEHDRPYRATAPGVGTYRECQTSRPGSLPAVGPSLCCPSIV